MPKPKSREVYYFEQSRTTAEWLFQARDRDPAISRHQGLSIMSSCHRIRLRGPWKYCFPSATREFPGGELKFGRIKLPTSWREAFGDRREDVKLVRSFGRPESDKPGETIWLELALSQKTRVELNSLLIGIFDAGLVRIAVTSLLEPRNKLCLEMESPMLDEMDATILEAALLIETGKEGDS